MSASNRYDLSMETWLGLDSGVPAVIPRDVEHATNRLANYARGRGDPKKPTQKDLDIYIAYVTARRLSGALDENTFHTSVRAATHLFKAANSSAGG